MERRQFLTVTGSSGLVGLAGCLGGNDADDDDGINIGMVYATGGLDDQSFNDMALEGVERAADDFGVGFQNAEPDSPGDVGELQRNFASDGGFELICCIGFVQATDLVESAGEFPDQNWMIVDAVAEDDDGPVDNVSNYVFREHEGSFQVGVIAGLLTGMDFDVGGGETNTDEKRVGFVGGQEVGLIERFEAGFTAGVAYADSEVEVTSAYTGSFSDPSTGQEIASSMYDSGADVVFHAAGASGQGVFEAASSAERYAIGVDDDQSLTAPEFSDVIVASMLKRVDQAVYESVENVVDDEFLGGEISDLGLEENGVGAAIGQDFEGELPAEITDTIEETRDEIIAGNIVVPDNLDDL